LPTGTSFVSATGVGWTCNTVAQVVTCTHGGLASGGQAPLTIVATAPAAAGPITNTGTISSSTSDPAAANNTATVTTTVGAASSDLAVTLTDVPDPVVSGGVITYAVAVSSSGPSPSGVVTVTDVLPAGTSFQSASGAGWTCVFAAGTITCTHAALAAGGTAPLTIALVAPGTPGVVSNTVTVAGVSADPAVGNNSTTATTTVASPPGADLAVTVNAGPNPVGTGGNESYSVNVANGGPIASGPVTVTDTLPTGATFAGATGTGWTCTVASGVVTCTHAALGNGESAPLTIDVTAPATPGTMTNVVTVSSTVADPSGTNNTVTTTTTVTDGAVGQANLSLTVAASPNPVAGGGTETYAITPKNNGPGTSGPITLTDTLPSGASLQNASGTGWTCTPSGSTVVCTHAALGNAASAPLTITVTAPNASGTMTNTATVTSTTTDPDDTDNTVVTSTTINGATGDGGLDGGGGGSDLSISVSVTPNPVAPGGTQTYTITASNAGPDPSGTVTVTDTLPTGATFTNSSGSGWNCTLVGNVLTCTHAPLASGESSQVSIEIQVPNTPGTITNTATVSSTGSDPNGANNGVVTTTTVGTTSGDGGVCANDIDCGGPTSGIVCDTTSNTCVLGCRGQNGNGCVVGQTCTSNDDTIGQCVSGDGGGICATDGDCGGPLSGLVCDASTSTCVPGCRGQNGNGCPVDQTCTSTDDSIGQCVAADGGLDGGTLDGGDGGDAAALDGSADGSGDGAASDGSARDGGAVVDGGGGDATPDQGVLEGGGCNCTTAGGRSGNVPTGLFPGGVALALLFYRRRRTARLPS
jgi:uncharacterized repeat protein (TIGR01451 family)/MYXO-CTERM domain-containing protein